MEPFPPQHRSYLLRLWRSGEGKDWRAMLEEVRSHETHHFANLEELCSFLREQTRSNSGKEENR
ncbi:MAG: hypothetical protein RML46_04525 [Anaerolineae bacterium]|nr:hypothetical protein [Anaerolineae bacterium]MDW8068157.1 hypothetical protein [Anaerolineae bacterium]